MIKFLDIEKVTESFKQEIYESISRIVKKSWYLLAEEVKVFEKEYSEYNRSNNCIEVANGLDADNQRRREIAKPYCENIHNPVTYYRIPVTKYLAHVWHLFGIRNPHRDELLEYLTDNGIPTLIHYPIPPHRQRAYKEWNNLTFPTTEKIHREALSLPI